MCTNTGHTMSMKFKKANVPHDSDYRYTNAITAVISIRRTLKRLGMVRETGVTRKYVRTYGVINE